MKPLVFALPGNETLAAGLVGGLDADAGALELRRFPDGESYVRILSPVAGRECLLVATLDLPDDKILPLACLATTAKDLSAPRACA